MSERGGERQEATSERPDDEQPRSGLRNPGAAVRGAGAGALVAEAIVMLLAIQPIRVLSDEPPGAGLWAVAGLGVVCLVLAGLLRHAWAWYAATALQGVLFALGFLVHGSLAVLGVVFGLLWLYVLHVRRRVLGRPGVPPVR
jgi:hypothetical protein